MKACINCGSLLNNIAKFCSRCGVKQNINRLIDIKCSAINENREISFKVKKSITIYIFGRFEKSPKIWIWQENGHECSKEMGYSWENRPYMQPDILHDCWKFVIDENYYQENLPFKVILDEKEPIEVI